MTQTTLYLLSISAGLLVALFAAIIYTWFFRYFSELTTRRVKKQLEDVVISYIKVASIKCFDVTMSNIGQRVNALLTLKSCIKYSTSRKEALISIILDYGDEFIESHHDILMNLYINTGIKAFLIKRLTAKSFFIKSLACRQLGTLKLNGNEGHIRKLMACQNNDVRYNVLLALAMLGDTKGLVYILTSDSVNINISYRAVIEILSVFKGSKEELFEQTLKLSDDYIKGILIKAAVDYKLDGLRVYYLNYLMSADKNLKIACIRALCALGDSADEEDIIARLDDRDWEVRAAAAKSLEKIGTSHCFTALAKAACDPEWWVRHNASSTLVLLPRGKEYAAQIINGPDKFAREAVASVLEMISEASSSPRS